MSNGSLWDAIVARLYGSQPQNSDDPELATLQQNFNRNASWSKPAPYQTQLSPDNEQAFRSWVSQNKIPYDMQWPPDQQMQDYDMRGFWQAQQAGDPQAVQAASNGHFPDTWKTPYHESFSNLSQYATPSAPVWLGNQLFDNSGNMIFDASQHP
jgi:hypothetical protein